MQIIIMLHLYLVRFSQGNKGAPGRRGGPGNQGEPVSLHMNQYNIEEQVYRNAVVIGQLNCFVKMVIV